MIFAMHQIQVACIVHHARGSAYFRAISARARREQYLDRLRHDGGRHRRRPAFEPLRR